MRKLVLLGLDGCAPTLLEEYAARGLLPNLRHLIDEGFYTRGLSNFPGVTPINWACIATGAHPGTHGIVDFEIHEPGEPLDAKHNAFSSGMLRAETLWESLGRQGYRTVTLNFPGAWPPRADTAMTVAGLGSPATHSPFEIRPSACFATAGLRAVMRDADLLSTPHDVIHLAPEWDSQGLGPTLAVDVESSEQGARVRVRGLDRLASPVDWIAVPDSFSPWFTGEFVVQGETRRGAFRLLLSAFDPVAGEAALYVSQIMPNDGISRPEALGSELIDAVGPMLENSGARGYERGWVSDQVLLQEGRYKGEWLARAAQHLMTNDRADAVFLKWHFLDHVAHLLWGQIDPASPWYDPARAEHFESLFVAAYQAADAMVGQLLAVLGPDDVLVVVSDHGQLPHLKALSINNLLEKAGLIQLASRNPVTVDWSRTLAYAGPCLGHVRVNLRGRDPDGVVEPDDYAAVQARVMRALTDWTDLDSGVRPIQLAVPIAEGAMFGQWGDRAGDILYFMEAGYTGDINWFPLTAEGTVMLAMSPDLVATADYGEGQFIASKFQSAHGCGLPGRRLGRGTEEPILFIRAGGMRGGSLSGRPGVQLVDIATTVSALLGVEPPQQAEGRIL